MMSPRQISGASRKLMSLVFAGQCPYRNIRTGNKRLTFGPAGGAGVVTDKQTRQLNDFLGRWQLERRIYRRSQQTSAKSAIKFLSKVKPNLRTSLTFKKNQELWTFQMEDADTKNSLCYDFYFGVDFIMVYPNGKLMQTVIYPEGELLKWEQQNLDVPSDMLQIITEVKGHILTWIFCNIVTQAVVYFHHKTENKISRWYKIDDKIWQEITATRLQHR